MYNYVSTWKWKRNSPRVGTWRIMRTSLFHPGIEILHMTCAAWREVVCTDAWWCPSLESCKQTCKQVLPLENNHQQMADGTVAYLAKCQTFLLKHHATDKALLRLSIFFLRSSHISCLLCTGISTRRESQIYSRHEMFSQGKIQWGDRSSLFLSLNLLKWK